MLVNKVGKDNSGIKYAKERLNYMDSILEIVDPSRLDRKYWYIIFLVSLFSFIYFISRSFIRWIIHRKALLLLSYIIVSLFVLSTYFAISLLNGGINNSFFLSFPLIMQSLATFGLILILKAMIRGWLK
ncbi:hypothetical protein [Virgibacillus sp. Bac330]|uniref:hypothetical protein n=1 Tax=Virgibacillus sp. Bac330 TaxID=2419841 RepID=UPI000EF454D2|nr:hypothetical protein [Virgibacillus sp. Bac330]